VYPYRLRRQAACARCDYRAVCRFDWQINDYHLLSPKGKLDVVQEQKAE
jgi:ATP-dependent helicase/DNAse subunit B